MEMENVSPKLSVKEKKNNNNINDEKILMINKNEIDSLNITKNSKIEPFFSDLKENKKEDKNKLKISFKFSFIIFFFILIILLAITIIILYINLLNEKSNFYTFDIDWVHNYLNTRKYTNYHFDNGLEVMLIHDSSFDMDGGAIVINKGYYDNPMDEGIATFITILLDKAFRNENNEKILDNYFGNYGYEINEDYTIFKFEILNSGFKKYLGAFSSVLDIANFSKLFDDFIEDNNKFNMIKEEMQKYYLNRSDYLAIKENHLLEYLVYNLKDENNNESLPEGNDEIISRYNKKELKAKTLDLFNKLINPENIKIVLFSKYKFLVSSKYMIKSFQYLINKKPENSESITSEKISFEKNDFKTSQIFYIRGNSYDTSYIKIIYYIDRINNETFSELNYKTGYFSYIVNFLSEKKKGSLYELLTKNFTYNIKSIDAEEEIIFKSLIKFNIYIELNSLDNINDIIFITYQFMHKIVKEGIGENIQIDRYMELRKYYDQRLLYTEKSFDTKELAWANGVHIFEAKYQPHYYFYLYWLPWDINSSNEENLNIIKNETYLYLNQLKPENSVIVLGIKDNDINIITCNDKSPFPLNCSYFKKEKKAKSKYYNIDYLNISFNSSEFEKYLDVNSSADISFVKNKYMSKNYDEIPEVEKKNDEIEEINTIVNSTLNTFYFKRNLDFRVPKVFISINLLHPYLRPLLNDKKSNDCYYFQILEICSAIMRKTNEALSNAILAGNKITFDYNENYLYINMYCYEDVAYNITKEIKKIIFDTNWSLTDFLYKNNIYKYETFDNFFNFQTQDLDEIGKFYFYSKVKNGFFNKYEFNKTIFEEDYEQFCFKNIINNTINNKLNKFIVNGLIYGNYSRDNAIKIAELFNRENFEEEESIIQNLLNEVNNSVLIDDFVYWTNEINQLNESDPDNFVYINKYLINKSDKNFGFRYVSLSNLSNNSDFMTFSLIENMFQNSNTNVSKYLTYVEMFLYGDIYFGFLIEDSDDSSCNPVNDSFINKSLKMEFEDAEKYYKVDVDNIGDRFYYLQRNLDLILFKKQSCLEQKANEELYFKIYNYTSLEPEKVIIDYNNQKKKHNYKFSEIKEYFEKINKQRKFDVYTVNTEVNKSSHCN